MEANFQSASFMKSLPAYRRMAEVLTAQRTFLGALDAADADAFARLGALAGHLHDVLSGYAAVMKRIEALGAQLPAPDAAPARVSPAPGEITPERVLSHLGCVPMALTRLQGELGMSRRELEDLLEPLQRANLVRLVLQGGRQMVRPIGGLAAGHE
jgi:hypothetical protein